MPDIFLYAGEPNPSDIRLSDPTVLRGGGAVIVEGTFSSSGNASSSWESALKLVAVFSSDGVGAAALVGSSINAVVLSSAGSSVADWSGVLILNGDFDSNGTSDANWNAIAFIAVVLNADASSLASWLADFVPVPPPPDQTQLTFPGGSGGLYVNTRYPGRAKYDPLQEEEEIILAAVYQFLNN